MKRKASNSYLSLIAVIADAIFRSSICCDVIFYLGNRKCVFRPVALYAGPRLQASLLAMNSCGFWWTISVLFRGGEVTNTIAYIVTVFF
jgi:hypothetical protein